MSEQNINSSAELYGSSIKDATQQHVPNV